MRQWAVAAAAMSIASASLGSTADAQKQGGTLRVWHRDSPGNMSILEEGTISIVAPIMGVFNNLVVFDPNVKQNSLKSIVPDLAESWSWSEDGAELSFKLRDGVKWHDGKPFTAADVKCTFDLVQGKSKEKLRVNAREAWWINLKEVTTEGDRQATFHLKRPQPAFIELLAAGFTPDLPLPRVAGPDAGASDRHRAFQICRIQAQPVDQGDPQPGLLETRPPLSRRRRVDDHPEPLHRNARFHGRAVRHDLSLRGHDPDAEGRAQPDAPGDL
jgi:ABC-type transport system substrate-binding protein